MADNKTKWTPQQKLAINERGRDILVSASAGTGKTAVLSGRCVDFLADKSSLTDASQILVLTFTDAAAEEMRSRIAQQLRSRFAKSPDGFLLGQLLGLDAAYISTIHSFCRRIITEHFYLLGIDPAFRIIAEDEQKLLKFEVLNETIEMAWSDSSLAAGLNELLYRRDVQGPGGGFLERIIGLSEYLDSVVRRDQWYDRADELAGLTALSSSVLAKKQKQIVLNKLTECRSQFEYSILLDKKFTDGYLTEQITCDHLAEVNDHIKSIRAGDFKNSLKQIAGYTAMRFKTRPKNISKDAADMVKAPAKKAIETLNKLRDLAVINPDYEQVVAPSAGLHTKVMTQLVKRFDLRYDLAKRQSNSLDFADLEHLMLRLLDENESIVEKLRSRFKYIFVDEYQDINALQQSILDKVSGGKNVFVVGDVKQSIYAFRQAKPEIFMERLKGASEKTGKENLPLRVDLSDNFRSRKGVLDFANAIFSRIMTKSVSLTDYDKRAFLIPGFDYKTLEEQGPLAEIYVLNEQVTGDEAQDPKAPGDIASVSASQRQAAFIAKRIKQMVGPANGKAEFKVYDKLSDDYRDVDYRDIVIIMRSPASRASEYVEVLRSAGIPVNSQSSAGYFAQTEITDSISLLKVLDNPQRDIEFAAVLRSPFFKMTDTELAMMRSSGTDAETVRNFYDCVVQYAQSGKDKTLREKTAEALSRIEQWRIRGRQGSLSDLLWHIYRKTGYISFVSALPNGRQRKANLLKMHDRAIQFEGFVSGPQTGSLTRFVEFIERLLTQGRDWAPAQADSTENAVRIMSVHRSKGLEFAVVFLAELNRKFNTRDSQEDCLIDEENALGLRIVEPLSKTKLSSIAHQVIAEEKLNTTLAEEMRILYVAMTRARERLILCASKKIKACADILTSCQVPGDEAVRHWQLRSAKCPFEWILYGLSGSDGLKELFDQDCPKSSVSTKLYRAERIELDELDEMTKEILRAAKEKSTGLGKPNDSAIKNGKELLSKIRKSLDWRYPYEELTNLQAKSSVSELTHPEDEFAKADLTNSLTRIPKAVLKDKAAEKTDGRMTGTATHLVIKELDLTKQVTPRSISTVIEKLVSENKLPGELAEKIDSNSIVKFFQSDLGRKVLENRDSLEREWEFTFAHTDPKLPDSADKESVVVQGVIDMVIPTADGLIIIDFKTDNVNAGNLDQRAKSYYKQLRLYAKAASAILKKDIAGTWLYFLKPGCAVNVE